MAIIRASCPTCGDVELTTKDVRVLLCSTTYESSYAFQCPRCRVAVAKPAEARVVDVLLASGIPLSVWHMPAELDEPRNGPPINYDDLLEFHFRLGSGADLDALLAGGPRRRLEGAQSPDLP
ncbi:MAG TPA: hypothetical protein VFJ97_11140 [Dermatophilaceae bacterium]|nr:hypothetical protein [Dermatophilaceae bacterium]